MKILSVLKLFILYFCLAGSTVECSWRSVIVDYLQNFISANDQTTREIDYKIPCGVSKFNSFASKIVGGTECAQNEFPWIASLQKKINGKFQHDCGCTVIHQSFVLTAAHCVDGVNPTYLQVIAGINNIMDINSENSQIRKVKKIYLNNYNSENFKNDIALAELITPLQLIEEIVAPICIPLGNELFYGDPMLAGWGRIKENGALPDVCQKVQLEMLNTTECIDMYKTKGFGSLLHTCQICTLTKNKDACQGDSGGSLMSQDENKKTFANGVVSWGVGCARPNNPGVYTQTSCYTSWITKTVNNK